MNRKEGSFSIGFGAVAGELAAISENTNVLHHDEISKSEDYKFERRRHSYLLGRLAAKYAIQNLTDQDLNSIKISEGIFQFPVIEHLNNVQAVQLSISHCEHIGLVLAYPEAHPVGIDIEQVNEKSRDALGTIVKPGEENLLSGLPISDIEGLSVIWTAKEALSKIFRTGMMMDFHTLELSSIRYEDGLLHSEFKNAAQYKAYSFIENEYAVSIVLPGRSETDADILRQLINHITRVQEK